MKTAYFVAAGLALALVAALAPAASANHDCLPNPNAYPCIIAGSFQYGDGECDNATYGAVQNYVAVNTGSTPAGFIGASASTYCYKSGSFSYSSIGASAYKSGGPGGYNSAGLGWYGYDFGSFSFCGSYVYTFGAAGYNYEALPLCDVAGAPPAVPALPGL